MCFSSVGMGLGACVAVHLVSHANKPLSSQQKVIGRRLPTPVCAALVLQSPAVAPAMGRAAVLLKSGPLDPFYSTRRLFSNVSVPTLIAVGKQQQHYNITCASVVVIVLFVFVSFLKFLNFFIINIIIIILNIYFVFLEKHKNFYNKTK